MKKNKKIRPLIILLRGKPAVGKSFIARFLSAEFNAPFIDKDDIKDVVAEYFTEQDLADQFSYAIMFNIASSYLKNNSAVICDSPLYPSYVYFKAQKLAQQFKVPLKIIHVVMGDVEKWKERLNDRIDQDLPFHRYKGWETHKQTLLTDGSQSILGELTLDSNNFDHEKNKLLEYLTSDN